METIDTDRIMAEAPILSYCRACERWNSTKDRSTNCGKCSAPNIIQARHESWSKWYSRQRGLIYPPTGNVITIPTETPIYHLLCAIQKRYQGIAL